VTKNPKPVPARPASSVLSERPIVAIVDPHDSGHHAMYVSGYLRALLQIGCDVMVIAPNSLLAALPVGANDQASVQRVPWEVADQLPLQASPEERAEKLWQALGKTLAVEALESGRYPNVVLLVYLDSFITELLRPDVATRAVSCPVVGLWFKPPQTLRFRWREQIRRLVRLGRRYRLFRSPRFAALLLLDPEAVGTIPGRPSRIITVPEFTDTSLPAACPALVAGMLERAAGRSISCLVGSIDARKGVGGFLEAAAAADAKDWFFVIAGKVLWDTLNPEVRRVLSDSSLAAENTLMLVDEWCPPETLNAIIAESDLLYACYENWPYSSNMLCKAAALGTPVIARDEGYIGRNVRNFSLGVLVPPGAAIAEQFHTGFGEAVASHAASPTFDAGCRQYLASNDLDALVASLEPLLRQLGCE
jgi:glycosyltransferase involved in cell wall biosynthesis